MRFNLTPHDVVPASRNATGYGAPFESLFGDFFRGLGAAHSTANETTLAPSLDVAETNEAYRVTVELPGVAEDDLELTWSEGVLTVAGEKRSETSSEDANVRRTERRYGSFRRQLALPNEINGEQVEASFDKGVLTVVLPKSPEVERSRRIPISSN